MIPKKKDRSQENKFDPSDLEIIFGSDYDKLDIFINNVFCIQCPGHNTSIVDYEVYLNKLYDIILKGKCKKCGGPVARYIETGENKEKTAASKHIKSKIKKYKSL